MLFAIRRIGTDEIVTFFIVVPIRLGAEQFKLFWLFKLLFKVTAIEQMDSGGIITNSNERF